MEKRTAPAKQPPVSHFPRPLAGVPELAAHYGVPQATVRRWHHTQTFVGPLMFRVGKYLRARWDDIERHDAEQASARRAA